MISRRNLILATATTMLPMVTSNAFGALIVPGERSLSLYNRHIGESVKATYWSEGEFIADELAAISNVLRDHRTDEVIDIDIALLGLKKHDYYEFIGEISDLLNRRVDVVLLEECRFAQLIKEKGKKWSRESR